MVSSDTSEHWGQGARYTAPWFALDENPANFRIRQELRYLPDSAPFHLWYWDFTDFPDYCPPTFSQRNDMATHLYQGDAMWE